MSLILTSWDDILAFIKDLHTHGISWGALISFFILWGKLKKNMKFKEHDERIESKLDAIMQKVGAEWSGRENPSSSTVVQNLKKLYESFYKRRVLKMNQVNWITLLPGLISAIKLVLQSFGIDIPDEHINNIVNGAASVLAIISIFLSHKKGGSNDNTQPTVTIGDNR
jgi:uncharacterized membrane protein